MQSIIELIESPYAIELLRARTDYAKITNQDLVERPWWYRHRETGRLFYDFMACLGWPSEVTDSTNGLPGYAAIVGIEKLDGVDPVKAKFRLMAEIQSNDVPELLRDCLKLRKEWGFGIQKELLRAWIGDPDRFNTTLALLNEVLIEDGEVNAILIVPPDDHYNPGIFDNYVRVMRSVLLKKTKRFIFGHNEDRKSVV